MSVVQQNQQALNNSYGSAIQEIMHSPDIAPYAQYLGQLGDMAYAETMQCLMETFDTGFKPLSQHEAENVIWAVIKGTAFGILTQYNVQNQALAPDYQYLMTMRQNRGQGPAPQPVVQQPVYQQPVVQPVYQQQTPHWQQPPVQTQVGTVHATSFQQPQSNGWNQPAPVGGGLDDDLITTPVNYQGEVPVDKSAHQGAIAQTQDYAFQQENVDSVSEAIAAAQQPKHTLPRIELVDKSECEFESTGSSSIALVFASIDEVRTKPVLVTVLEPQYIPAFNPSPELIEKLHLLQNCDTIDCALTTLMDISKQYSIPGVISWIDKLVTQTVEKTLHYRYGKTKLEVGSFIKNRSKMDGFLMKMGWKEDIHAVALNVITTAFGHVDCSSFDIKDGKTGVFIESIIHKSLLTVPWAITHSSQSHEIYVEGTSEQELFDVLDQAFGELDDCVPFITVADLSSMQYQVWCQGRNTSDLPKVYRFIPTGI